MTTDGRSREWVKKLPLVIKALNDQETRLIGLKPKDAIQIKLVKQNPAAPAHRLVGKREKKIAGNARVRYLYAPREAENDTRRRAKFYDRRKSTHIVLFRKWSNAFFCKRGTTGRTYR